MCAEKLEIRLALRQSAAILLLRSWNETCRIFLDYLKSSSYRPFKNADAFFAKHEFQSCSGNLLLTHIMLKVMWNGLTDNEISFVQDLIHAETFEIVKPHESQRFLDENTARALNHLKKSSSPIKNYYAQL